MPLNARQQKRGEEIKQEMSDLKKTQSAFGAGTDSYEVIEYKINKLYEELDALGKDNTQV